METVSQEATHQPTSRQTRGEQEADNQLVGGQEEVAEEVEEEEEEEEEDVLST